jgi:hypothetical protein
MTAPLRHCLLLFALAAPLAGCARNSEKRFIPSEEAARAALETALESWRRGEPHGPVAGTTPVVHFVDSHHKPGQRLKGFEVQTLAPGEGPRVFTVRLRLEGPADEVRTRYVVVGLDPVWVLRQEDYDMIAHWEHPMKKP